MSKYSVSILILFLSFFAFSQADSLQSLYLKKISSLDEKVKILESTELVQSMSQRSLLTPLYFPELKALIAKQAYDFWINNSGDKYISHLNVYAALYYSNKYLEYDSLKQTSWNQILGHSQSVISVQFGNDPDYFYSAGSDGKVLKWDFQNPNQIPIVLYQGNHLIRTIDITRDGKFLMIVSKEKGVTILGLEDQFSENDPALITDSQPVQAAIFLPKEQGYLSVMKNGELKVIGYKIDTVVGVSREPVLSLTINPDDSKIFAGTVGGKLKMWQESLLTEEQFEGLFSINAIALSSDHKLLAIGREKGDVILWDLEIEEIKRVISGHQSAITDIEFSPNDSLLLTASRDRTVRVWDVKDSRKFPIILDDHNDWVMTACFDLEGNNVISGSMDNYIRIFPIQHKILADRICKLIDRNLSLTEWNEYIGDKFSYQQTCPVK